MPSQSATTTATPRGIAAAPPGHSWAPSVKATEVLAEGWVLKKKRKKIQGYAKRYVYLTAQGILTYSMAPGKPTRDFIEIPHASVISSKRHGTIHVDSGSSVFHLKALSASDFEMWRKQLKSFISERQGGTSFGTRRIYVVADGNKDLVSVDLEPVFAHSDRLARSIETLQQETGALAGSGASSTEAQKLQALISSLSKEYFELSALLSSKVPHSDAGSDRTLVRSRAMADPGYVRKNQSFASSLGGEEDAVFYDADDIDLDNPDDAGKGEESTGDDSDEGEDDKSDEIEASPTSVDVPDEGEEHYRTKLPSKVVGDDVGILGVLKKNVGKDLSTISFPVSFNLPLSLLQAAAEEYEYAPALLERAAQTDDWSTRICLIGAWAVSGYAASKLRASRKPFNPMLGETFELVREGGRLKFLAEKVVHNPPIVATYAEGHGWRAHGWSTVKQKFWGKSWELIPEGSLMVDLPELGETYAIKKPGAFMRNLIAGQKYIEYVGELVVTNINTNQKLKVDFKQGTVLGGTGSRNHLAGHVYDTNGSNVGAVKGKWTDSFAIQHDKENYQVLWEAAPFPPHAEDYYGFTYFAMTLNELSPTLSAYLPRTDSRFRPDQRAFENGQVDQAEDLKQAVETAQRRRRTYRQEQGIEYHPTFFHCDPNQSHTVSTEQGMASQPDWLYGGPDQIDYFKKRTEAIGAGPKKAQSVWDAVVPEVFPTN